MPIRQRLRLSCVVVPVIALLCVVSLPRLSSWINAVTVGTDTNLDVQRDNPYTRIDQEKCLDYSPSYPSAGGPGCSSKCADTVDGQRNSSYAAGFYNTTHRWPDDLINNMHLAARILKKYGTPNSLDTERSIYLHVTFDYYCCFSPEEGRKIGEFLNGYSWTPHEAWFDQMVCAIHATGDMVSLVLMVDERSQKELTQWVLDLEKNLEREGVRTHVPHDRLQGFHMTLATVNQSVFPVQPALKEINTAIPPGTWHSSPVVLHRPICNKCERVMAMLKRDVI